MPARDAIGGFVLQICPGAEPVSHGAAHGALLDREHVSHPDQGSRGDHEGMPERKACDYATGAFASLRGPPVFAIVTEPFEVIYRMVSKPLTGIYPRGLPPATGPPGF